MSVCHASGYYFLLDSSHKIYKIHKTGTDFEAILDFAGSEIAPDDVIRAPENGAFIAVKFDSKKLKIFKVKEEGRLEDAGVITVLGATDRDQIKDFVIIENEKILSVSSNGGVSIHQISFEKRGLVVSKLDLDLSPEEKIEVESICVEPRSRILAVLYRKGATNGLVIVEFGDNRIQKSSDVEVEGDELDAMSAIEFLEAENTEFLTLTAATLSSPKSWFLSFKLNRMSKRVTEVKKERQFINVGGLKKLHRIENERLIGVAENSKLIEIQYFSS